MVGLGWRAEMPMPSVSPLRFDDADLLVRLPCLVDSELDELAFGVVEMNAAGVALRYNLTEAEASGLAKERVIGRNFFRDVAPCTNNERVAGRYLKEETLDETIPYTFAFRMKPVPVTLRMLRGADGDRMYLIVSFR